MSLFKPVTCRRARSAKHWAIVTIIAMVLSTASPVFVPAVKAQAAPIGNGFVIDAGDLRFIFHAIEVAQEHTVTRTAANPCGTLLGPGPNQVNLFGTPNPQLPLGLRTVDGSCNNLVPAPDQRPVWRVGSDLPARDHAGLPPCGEWNLVYAEVGNGHRFTAASSRT